MTEYRSEALTGRRREHTDPNLAPYNQGKPALQSEFSNPLVLAVDPDQHRLIVDSSPSIV
jgi:hypothetical protein